MPWLSYINIHICILFVNNWKSLKEVCMLFLSFQILDLKKKKSVSSIYPQSFIKSRKHSFYGNLILIYMWVFIIWFLLSLLSLLLYSKCCDHSFLFGFSCLLLYLTEVTVQSIDLYPLFSTTKMVQYYFFLETYRVCTIFC